MHADVRNQGTRDLIVWHTQVTQCELEMDGRWYRWAGGRVRARSSWFPPARDYTDIPITLVNKWHTTEGDRALALMPGQRLAFFKTEGPTIEQIPFDQIVPEELEPLKRRLISYDAIAKHLYFTGTYRDPAERE